jgi:nucleotide-binding universal stress UspA family protein
MKTLLLVDGSENALRATRHAIGLAHANSGMEIHVLNVQEPLEGRVRAYLSKQEIDKIERDAGREALASAEKLLVEAEIPHRSCVRVGSIPESIAQYVDDEHCAAIVMGTRGMSAIANLVMGSVATKVVHAVHVPVTLVK